MWPSILQRSKRTQASCGSLGACVFKGHRGCVQCAHGLRQHHVVAVAPLQFYALLIIPVASHVGTAAGSKCLPGTCCTAQASYDLRVVCWRCDYM
jgi:hypothetical protein